MVPMHWIHGWGLAYGIYPWGSALVMGKFDGETFLGGLLIFFLGGRGGKRKRQGTVSRVGRWTTRAFKQPHFVLYYILRSGSFALVCLHTISNGDPPILDVLVRQVCCSDFEVNPTVMVIQ
jgi:hypothetical protein